MKLILSIMVFLLSLNSFAGVGVVGELQEAQQQIKDIFCENGTRQEMGDAYSAININNGEVSFESYEGAINVTKNDIFVHASEQSALIAIIDAKVSYLVEGDEQETTVTAGIYINYALNYLTVQSSFDGGEKSFDRMSCEFKE